VCGRAEVGGNSTLTTGWAGQQQLRSARRGGTDQTVCFLAARGLGRRKLIPTQPVSDRRKPCGRDPGPAASRLHAPQPDHAGNARTPADSGAVI